MRASLPRSSQVTTDVSNRTTRAASLGLAAVVICLAAFSIFAAYAVRTQVDRSERSEAVVESYEGLLSALNAGETVELEFLLEPTSENIARLEEAGRVLTDAVNEVAAQGGTADVLALHAKHLLASERSAGAMAAGDLYEARAIHEREAHPVYLAMRGRITDATEERLADSQSALAELGTTARWMLILSPIVFAIGFALLIVLWRILDQADHARRKTYRQIEQLSRLRGEFVSIVSHEFRTPLTGVQGFSEMMRDEELTIPEMREYAGDINKDARRLSSLISDMLDLDLMESGRMTLRFAPVDVNRIVMHAAATFSSSATDHPIELLLAEGLANVNGDSERLTQVVTNLLSNAIKYSPSGGGIDMETKRDGRMVMLSVRDHGIGIPAEQLEKIFDRYSRIEATGTPSVKGIGLGLAIVSQIVQLHQGKVWATSEAGEGSVFHLQLPLLASSTVAPSAAQSLSRVRPA